MNKRKSPDQAHFRSKIKRPYSLPVRLGKPDEPTVRIGQLHDSEEGRVDPGSDEKENLDENGIGQCSRKKK